MAATSEDPVVAALNEVRRFATDRIRREAQARGQRDPFAAPAMQPMTDREVTFSTKPRSGSAVGAVFLTVLILGGAAAGGYYKLRQQWETALAAKDQSVLQAQQNRNQAIEAAANADRKAKLQIAALESRVSALTKEKEQLVSASQADKPASAPARKGKTQKNAKPQKRRRDPLQGFAR
jgi:hypothetical protein